jgi:hypothetical protein
MLRQKVDCYLAPSEKADLEHKAKLAGLPLSTFLRESALGKKISPLPTVNAQRWAELAPLQANLNQLLRHINRGERAAVELDLLKNLLHEVRALRSELMAVGE